MSLHDNRDRYQTWPNFDWKLIHVAWRNAFGFHVFAAADSCGSFPNQTSEVQTMHIPFAFLLMAFLSVPVFAAESAGSTSSKSEEQLGACRADLQKFCGKVQPGEGRVARCIQENEKSFSPACKTALEQHRADNAVAKGNTCRSDLEKFCKGVQAGEGRIMNCMREHEKELSEGCRTMLKQRAASGARK
jgi:hypothetical protein